MKTLRDAIYSVVDALKASAGFNATYYEMPTSIETMPAVAILTDGGQEIYESTAENTLELQVRVRTMTEKQDTSDNDKDETDKILTINDAILAELRKKTTQTLSGESYYLLSAKIEPILVGPIENMNVFYQDIIFTVKTTKDVTL